MMKNQLLSLSEGDPLLWALSRNSHRKTISLDVNSLRSATLQTGEQFYL